MIEKLDIGLFLVKKKEKGEQIPNITDIDQVETIGVLGKIINISNEFPLSRFTFTGLKRIRAIEKDSNSTERLSFKVEEVIEPEIDKNDQVINANIMEIISSIKELSILNPFYKEQLNLLLEEFDLRNPLHIAELASYLTTMDSKELQEVLSSEDAHDRIIKALIIVKSGLETARIQKNIQQNLEEKIPNQRKYVLEEQLRLIQKELGVESDERNSQIQKFENRLKGKTLNKDAENAFKEESTKLKTLEASSAEYNVTRNYLDWLTILPWGLYQEEKFNITKSKKILDRDHYGMKKIKERILEFIAVGKLKQSVQGKIICFVGPPGVGKTSIGKSIASALGREFHRFSVGGMSDVAEIKGHRRTYIGSMPGKMIQLLKLSKTSNPVVMIDEIDKLGRGHGDPASALLEVLDPEQNGSFLDHYLDVPYDLSKVLFVCTANSLDSIPKPLLDRMEVLRLSGYILEEKMNIAKNYLIPKIVEESGLKNLNFTDSALNKIIREYCREAGVRSLEKKIESICRKVALSKVRGKVIKTIDETQVETHLGLPIFTSDRFYEITPPGTTMGLAWTSMGGATLYIESVVLPTKEKKPSLKLTGQMGEVMKESSTIAYTFAKNFVKNKFPENTFFKDNAIHLHIPEVIFSLFLLLIFREQHQKMVLLLV